jgi:3-oxoacyl-[acyl-carrier protein] reductase
MDLGLNNKVAVITGGSVGIGLAIAEGLAAEGVHVVLAARGAERVQGEAKRIAGEFGVRAEGGACDVATRKGTDAHRRGREGFRRGGHSHRQRRHRQQRDGDGGAGREMAELLGPAVRLARGLAPLMKARGGGVMMFSRCLATELAATSSSGVSTFWRMSTRDEARHLQRQRRQRQAAGPFALARRGGA